MNKWKFTFEAREFIVEAMHLLEAISKVVNGNYNENISFCTKIEIVN